jgi:hypothetical protein
MYIKTTLTYWLPERIAAEKLACHLPQSICESLEEKKNLLFPIYCNYNNDNVLFQGKDKKLHQRPISDIFAMNGKPRNLLKF